MYRLFLYNQRNDDEIHYTRNERQINSFNVSKINGMTTLPRAIL